jgi:hypothetical protein
MFNEPIVAVAIVVVAKFVFPLEIISFAVKFPVVV